MIEENDPLLARLRALPPREMDESGSARVRLKARTLLVERTAGRSSSSFFARLQQAYFRAIEPALVLGTVSLGLAYAVAAVNGIIH